MLQLNASTDEFDAGEGCYSLNLLTLGHEVRAPVDIVLTLPDPDGQ